MERRSVRVAGVALALLVAAAALAHAAPAPDGGGHGSHKKVIIHVPYHIKKIHHTHTVYKIIGKHGGGGGGGHETLESWGGGGHGW